MLDIGASAPDFILDDYRGKTHRLADALADGPVVIAFLKADCAACQLTFPYLETLHQAYPTGDWHIWGVSQHPARAAEWFAKNTGVTFPLLVDEEGFPVSRAYDPEATPTIFFLDRTGKVRSSHLGLAKDELNALSGQIAAELGTEAVVVASMDDGKPAFRPG